MRRKFCSANSTFYDAVDLRLALQAYVSCNSCHAGGGQDGRVWDLGDVGEGLRNTIDLRGRSGTGHGRVHWSANFDEIHDFENQIRGMPGGQGFLNATQFAATQDPLGTKKAGMNADLDALAAYVTSLSETVDSPLRKADGNLTAAAEAGKEIFKTANCAQCHSGTTFTDSPADKLHDVGTIKAVSGDRSGQTLTGIDTPTLRGVWNSAPYLHDGSAPTLQQAIQAHQGLQLSTAEVNSLAVYLSQIDDAEPEAPGGNNPGDGNDPAPQNLAVHIPFEEGQGNTAADKTNNANNAQFAGAVKWSEGGARNGWRRESHHDSAQIEHQRWSEQQGLHGELPRQTDG